MAWTTAKKPEPPKSIASGDEYRPSYSAVSGIFQSYLRSISYAALRTIPKDQHEAYNLKAKQQLEKELEQVGLAKHIAFDH